MWGRGACGHRHEVDSRKDVGRRYMCGRLILKRGAARGVKRGEGACGFGMWGTIR